MDILRQHKKAIGWKLSDLPGINPSIYMHRILMEEEIKPIRQQQRRLNPTILNVVKKEVTKLLTTSIIYPISDSQWVSPMQVVPKKSGMIVMKNQHDELECMEVFMDDFTEYADSFEACLENLFKVLKRCVNTNLVLNFEKCHFMPTSVREVHSFLRHVGFYRRFIKNFNKLALPLSKLLQKDVEFKFDQPCIEAFQELKS
ncbi:hypothetical protein CR513_03831, partial [Mucuna pruriens]